MSIHGFGKAARILRQVPALRPLKPPVLPAEFTARIDRHLQRPAAPLAIAGASFVITALIILSVASWSGAA